VLDYDSMSDIPNCPNCNAPIYCGRCGNGQLRTAKQRKLVALAAKGNGEVTQTELAKQAGYRHPGSVSRALSSATVATAVASRVAKRQDKARRLKDLIPTKLVDKVEADELTPAELAGTWKVASDIVERSPDDGSSVKLTDQDMLDDTHRQRRRAAAFIRYALDRPMRAATLLGRLNEALEREG